MYLYAYIWNVNIFMYTFLCLQRKAFSQNFIHSFTVNDRLAGIFFSVEQTDACMTAVKFGNTFNVYIKTAQILAN